MNTLKEASVTSRFQWVSDSADAQIEALVCASKVKRSRSLSSPRCPGRFATAEKGLESYD